MQFSGREVTDNLEEEVTLSQGDEDLERGPPGAAITGAEMTCECRPKGLWRRRE